MILHAFWEVDSCAMAFWAERSREEWLQEVPSGKPPRHPGTLPFSQLKGVVPRALDVYEDEITILLPTSGYLPRATLEAARKDERLRPWYLQTAHSIGDCVMEWMFERDEDLPDFKLAEGANLEFGETVQFWLKAAEFARVLVWRSSFAPGIVRLEQRYYPSWQAVFTPNEEAYWHELERHMPAACLANYQSEGGHDKLLGAKTILLSFIDAAVDHLVRRRLLRQNARRLQKKKASAPPHRQWLSLLKHGRLSSLEGTPRELSQFADEVRSWNQFMRLPYLKTPFRLVFQLSSPPDEEEPWRVHYALQAARDPSLLLRAEQLWNPDADTSSALTARGRETLLAGLGRAIGVFPQIRESLAGGEPAWCELDKFEAIEFMSKTAPLLRRHGFHVILPSWWEDPDDALHLTLRITPAGLDAGDRQPALGIEQLVQYRWDVALGDQLLSEDEFRALALTKEPLIHRDGKWFRLDAQALRKSVNLLDKREREGHTSLEKAMKLSLELEKNGVVPIIDFQTESDPTELLRNIKPNMVFREFEPPPGFIGELRPYQIKGFSWLSFVGSLGYGACLADDMGLGKTVQMITALLQQRVDEPEEDRPSLIICPMSVVGNWVKEINRFAPAFKVMVHHGSDREQLEQFVESANQHDIVITTYALAVRDQVCLLRCYWSNIILDEAQNIKNPSTKQALAIRSLRGGYRYCLTGTPIENRLTELWSIMEFLNPGYLGRQSSFRANFSVPIERDKNPSRADVLQKIIRPFVLRRLKSDRDVIRDLPEKQEMKVFCNLTTEQAAIYQAVVDDMLTAIDGQNGIGRRGMVLTTLMKLKQVTNHPSHFLRDNDQLKSERSGKLQRMEEMLEILLEERDRALVFTQFSEFGGMLHKKLERKFGIEVLYMHGGTPKHKREEMVNRFQARNGPQIFLLSLKAGGVGLNLTAACHVFHFDRWWNPAVENQATDRAFRIGQTRNVQVHKFVCIGTVEEKIDQMLDEKKRLADFIVTPGEEMLTELSTEELRQIFSLTRDAVVE